MYVHARFSFLVIHELRGFSKQLAYYRHRQVEVVEKVAVNDTFLKRKIA